MTSVVLPVEVPPATRMFFRSRTPARSSSACTAGHDAGLDVVVEGEDRDGRPADGEARRGHDGRHQALEPLPGLRQFGGDARAAGVNLDADMVRDEPHDALGVGGRDAQPVSSRPPDSRSTQSRPSGLSITSTMLGIFQIAGDRRPERGAQHARAAGESFRSEGDRRHVEPRDVASVGGGCQRG